MNIARTLRAALAATVVVAAATSALADPPAPNDPNNDGMRWIRVGSFVASDQARQLEHALARYRGIQERGGWGRVPDDLVMGPGNSYDCKRIAALEWRMVAEGYLDQPTTPAPRPDRPRNDKPMGKWGPCAYTPALAAAVGAFQQDRKIIGSGQLGTQTMTALNIPVEDILDILAHDVERWRALSLEESGNYILVNIPFFELSVFEDDREAMRMPVIVGQPTWQTPQFSDELEYIIVNPDWGIPDKIAKAEYLPSARKNPKWLAAQGIEQNGGSLRQKPGPQNPLGRIKFVMPNKNDVYLHDTPLKGAFKAKVRALSHGCIRLSQPMDLAHYLLRGDAEWNPARLQQAISSGKTLHINLRRREPVHIIYSTSRVNVDGRLELRPDVYGLNRGKVTWEEAPRIDEGIQAYP